MGCISSSVEPAPAAEASHAAEPAPAADAPAEPTPAKEPTPTTAAEPDKPAKPSPQIFAIMRNGHEVLRGMMRDIIQLMEKAELAEARAAWQGFMLWQSLHAMMEDGVEGGPTGFFHRLNIECDRAATKAGLDTAHTELHAKEQAVEVAMEGEDAAAIKVACEVFVAANEAHLKVEEEVMMPRVQEMKKKGVNLREVMRQEMLASIWEHAEFGGWVKAACSTLETHHDGKPRARVFVHALQAASEPEQWATWLPNIKEGLSPELFAAIDSEVGLEAKV